MPSARKPRSDLPKGASQLRIIGGQWRGRKLAFTPAEGLRPTTDRVRETLFNWLMADIHDARCLDLFCGSGALGLEALSRGAAHCDFVDTNGANLRQLERHLLALGAADRASLHHQSAADFLQRSDRRDMAWDITFIDPPFGHDLAAPACQALQAGHLAPEACVYLECGRQEAPVAVPAEWQLHRDKTAGEVSYRLYHCPA